MRKAFLIAGALVLSTSLCGPAWAQPKGPGMRAEVRARVSEAVQARVVTALALDPATAEKLHAIVVRHGAAIEAAEQAQQQRRRALQTLVASRSNDATAYNQASDALLAGREQHRQLVEARQREIRALLTPAQFAMLLLEYPKIEKQVKLELLRAAGRGEVEEP